MSEILVPEVKRVGAASVVQHDWRGRKKGERLTYRWKTTPYRHQVEAVKKLLSLGWGGALLMEPRCGKSKTFIDYASILYTADKIDRVLVFCPVSAIDVWVTEFEAHCPVPYRMVVWDRDGRKDTELPAWGDKVLSVVVVNYDALSTPGRRYKNKHGRWVRSKTKGGRHDIYKALAAWAPQLIGLDESHRIKGHTAQKSKMIHRLGPVADYRVIMTGTVVTKQKRVFDVWSQWQFLNPERFPMDFADFRNYYGKWIQRTGYLLWRRNIHTDELHKQIHLDAYSITRAECFDLPPRLPNQIVRVPLTDSARAYDDMAEDMVHRIETGEITEASLRIVQSLRLRQLTGGMVKTLPTPQHPEGRLHRVGQEKLDVLEDMLVDLQDMGEKVVIGCQFTADIRAIKDLCEDLKIPCYLLYGAVKRADRDQNIRDFRAYSGGCAVFLMQPQAGSLGIDLRTAGTFIWYSLTMSYVDHTQAEDRIALNEKGTKYIYLLAAGTIDELNYSVLQDDGDLVKLIMSSPERLLRTNSPA